MGFLIGQMIGYALFGALVIGGLGIRSFIAERQDAARWKVIQRERRDGKWPRLGLRDLGDWRDQ